MSMPTVQPSMPPSAVTSVANTPAPSIRGSIANSEIPLVALGRNGVREHSTDRNSDEERQQDDRRAGSVRRGERRASSSTNGEILASALAPIDGGRQAWIFLLGCFTLEFIIWGQSYSYGSYQEYHTHDRRSPLYGQSPAAISSIGTLVIGTQCFVPLLTRGFSRTFPHLIRPTTLACIVLSAVCLLASSFMTNVVPLLVLQSLYGLASGITFTPVILYLNQWWSKRLGLATGIVFAGSGIGGIVFPPVITVMLDRIGFPWTMRILAFLTLVLSCGATYCLTPRLPIASSSIAAAFRRSDRSIAKQLLPGDLRPMLGPLAGLNEMAIFMQSCAWYTISLYISTYCISLGFSPSTATGVLSAFNASATVGYLIVGPLIDRLTYTMVMFVSMMICSLSAFLFLGFSHSLPLIVLFVLTFGMAGGGFTTFMSPLARDVALLNNNQEPATIFLCLVFLRGLASVVGPLIGAALYDNQQLNDFSIYGTRGFRGIVVFVGASMLVGSLLAFAATWQRRKDMGRHAALTSTGVPIATGSAS